VLTWWQRGLRSSYSTKRSRNVAHTPDTQKCGVFQSVHLKIRSAYVADFLRCRYVAHKNYTLRLRSRNVSHTLTTLHKRSTNVIVLNSNYLLHNCCECGVSTTYTFLSYQLCTDFMILFLYGVSTPYQLRSFRCYHVAATYTLRTKSI
jgi:hypothetical protein